MQKSELMHPEHTARPKERKNNCDRLKCDEESGKQMQVDVVDVLIPYLKLHELLSIVKFTLLQEKLLGRGVAVVARTNPQISVVGVQYLDYGRQERISRRQIYDIYRQSVRSKYVLTFDQIVGNYGYGDRVDHLSCN